jgi:hypothetical protein
VASVTDICNLALGRIGHGTLLTEYSSDQSKAGRYCRQNYPLVRDRLIESVGIDSFQRIVVLVLASGSIPGWTYLYAMPEGALFVEAVCDEGGARAWGRRSVFSPRMESQESDPFRLFYNGSDPVIATDVANAYAVVRVRVENTTHYPPAFVSALAWELAMELAGPLEVDADLQKMATQMAYQARAEAAATSRNQSLDDRQPLSPALRARG